MVLCPSLTSSPAVHCSQQGYRILDEVGKVLLLRVALVWSAEKISDAIAHVREVEKDWNMPSFATEFFDCRVWTACEQANISHMYWHYSCFCNTGADFGNRTVPTETFLRLHARLGGGRQRQMFFFLILSCTYIRITFVLARQHDPCNF